MKNTAVPGVGEFGVEVKGNCDYVTLPRNKRVHAMLAHPWVGEMHLFLKKRLKAVGFVDQIRETQTSHERIYKITPTQLGRQVGKKNRRKTRALQQEIWKAIKAFIKQKRRALQGVKSSKQRKERWAMRPCPALIPARRAVVALN